VILYRVADDPGQTDLSRKGGVGSLREEHIATLLGIQGEIDICDPNADGCYVLL